MPIRAALLLVTLIPASAAAQERLLLASVTVETPPAPSPPRAVPGGAIRTAQAPGTAPGLWLDF